MYAWQRNTFQKAFRNTALWQLFVVMVYARFASFCVFVNFLLVLDETVCISYCHAHILIILNNPDSYTFRLIF